MKSKQWILGAASAAALLLLGLALLRWAVPGALVVGSLNDKEVRGQAARLGGPARFHADGNVATLQLGQHTARVTAESIELAGGRAVKIPANCKRIELIETRRGIRVIFDGAEQEN